MSHRLRRLSPLFALSLLAVACDGKPTPPAPTATDDAAAHAKVASAEEATKFVADLDRDLRRLWTQRERALWIAQNFITDDTEALAAAAEKETAAYMTRAIQAATRFDGAPGLSPDVARQLHLLKLAQLVPAPTDEGEGEELAKLQVGMTAAYGKGKYCAPAGSALAKGAPGFLKSEKVAAPEGASPTGSCYALPDLARVLARSRSCDGLTEGWGGWRAVAPAMRDKFERYVELGNKGAKAIGFDDMGALWRSGYDMPPAAFESEVERLWEQVKPLYEKLHCYVRSKLQAKYGKEKIPDRAPIPAQLLGNMWAQEWDNVYDLVEPYRGEASLDVTKSLKEKKYDAVKMVKLGESFFTSLGLDPLPETFWQRSLFTKPADREVVCHASAWDVTWSDDLRIKMCIEPTENDLITIHHELGHNYYFHQYTKLPVLFQQGANDGFHEGIGDTLALSVTPPYLKRVGLLAAAPEATGATPSRATINQQLKMALEKVAFLPFGLLIDKWRWDVFSGKTPKAQYNEAWWALRAKYQGVAAPVERTADDFDPGAKYHVPASTPYARYFLARIYQFQFHRALCKAAGHEGPLSTCSIYGNPEAGRKLGAMLAMGASRPWPEAMAAISGERSGDASALLEYFAPLTTYLDEQTATLQCGW